MGKNGKALREAKKKRVVYTFTAEELRSHDKAIISEFRERVMAEARAFVEKEREEYRRRFREEFDKEMREERKLLVGDGTEADKFMNILQFTISAPVKVLCERFRWLPINGSRGDSRKNLAHFVQYVIDEIDSVIEDDNADIRRYCEDVDKRYGVRFWKVGDEDANT